MTVSEAKKIDGKLCLFDLNGSKYHKVIVGSLKEINGQEAIIERLEGVPLPIFLKNIEGFEEIEDKRDYKVCPPRS